MNLLPPETTTPMPPQLHYVYAKELGWPGRPDQRPPAAMPPRTVVIPRRRWPLFKSQKCQPTQIASDHDL